MALSDLELLSLVERAQEAKQGPIGPQGVGIRSIEQPDASTVVISLTDGRTKEINLTAGPKGDPGEAGKPGRDGAEGRPGSAGKAGAAGVGVAGAPGRDGTSIDTAIVNADGNLLLGLTDGNVLNVGRVVGPAGATGPTGATGLPGRAGRDGNTILSAPHAPSDDEGNTGDFWIDTSSPLFDFYGKGSSGWRKLTSLRAPQTPVGGKMSAGGGGGGNGGSGGGALQNTATLPLANPSRYKPNGKALPPSDGLKSQKDFNEWLYASLLSIEGGGAISVGQIPPMPSEKGMLWFSTNEDELTLFIYVDDQSGWVPAAPPVSLDGINTAISDVQSYIDIHVTPALAGAVGDINALEQAGYKLSDEVTRLGLGVDEAHQKADQMRPELDDATAIAEEARAKNTEQDGRLDAIEATQGSGPDGNFAELDKPNTFTEVNTFNTRTVMNNTLTLSSATDSHRLYIKNKTGETNLTLFPNGSISSKSHINFSPTGKDTFQQRYSSYFRVDSPDGWTSGDGDFGLYVDISRANTQHNRFVVGGRAGREKAFEVYDDGKGRARVYGNFKADENIQSHTLQVDTQTTTDTLEVTSEAAFKDAQFTGSCDVSNASHTNNCALPKSYFSGVLKEFNGQFGSIYINHGTNGTSDPPIQIKASSSAGSLIELLNSSNAARFGINVHNAYMYGGTAASPWMPSSDHHFVVKKYVDREVEKAIQVQGGPSGMWFKYGGEKQEPGSGEFTLDNNELFIDCTNNDGVIWHEGATMTSLAKIWSHCTIYELSNAERYTVTRMYQLEEFMFRSRNSRKQLRFGKIYQKFGSGLPTVGQRYLLCIGGFF